MNGVEATESMTEEGGQSPYSLQGVIEVTEEERDEPASYKDLGIVPLMALGWCVALGVVILVCLAVRWHARRPS